MSTIVVTGARAPVALHLARLFHAVGCRVVLADTLARPLASMSAACARYVRLPPPDRDAAGFARALRALCRVEAPALIVPTCEEVFYLAWAREAVEVDAEVLAPSFARLRRAHSKALFAEDARAFGLAPPASTLIESRTELEALKPHARRLVIKPVWSRFASAVLISPRSRDLDRLAPSPSMPWIAQELVPGEEICCYALARDGRLLTSAAYRPRHRAGRGAGIYFDPVVDDAVTAQCAAYVAATRWSGQISFDFRRDAAGRLRVLECNPRATSGAHFYGAPLADAMLRGSAAVPDMTTPLMIPAAMVLYGLPAALRAGALRGWWRDLGRARDALAWPADPLPALAQPRALAEMAGVALGARISLIAASTHGIAWNGQAIVPAAPAGGG